MIYFEMKTRSTIKSQIVDRFSCYQNPYLNSIFFKFIFVEFLNNILNQVHCGKQQHRFVLKIVTGYIK